MAGTQDQGLFTTSSLLARTVEDNRSLAVRAFTGGIFSFDNVPTSKTFVFDTPVSEADRQGGGVCSVTGYWAPARRLVSTSRGRAIDIFAPNDKVIQ